MLSAPKATRPPCGRIGARYQNRENVRLKSQAPIQRNASTNTAFLNCIRPDNIFSDVHGSR